MKDEVKQILDEYQGHGYVFTSSKWYNVIVLERTPNTITNEDRKNVIDKDYATFKGNRFIVKDIINTVDLDVKETCVMLWNIRADTYRKYEIGKVVYVDKYDECKLYSDSIEYTISYLPAYYYLLSYVRYIPDTEYRTWHWINGVLCSKYECQNGVFDGKYQKYDVSGMLEEEGTYSDGVLHGIRTKYENGIKTFECNYINNIEHGMRQLWYKTGQIMAQMEVHGGEIVGINKWFEKNGDLQSDTSELMS